MGEDLLWVGDALRLSYLVIFNSPPAHEGGAAITSFNRCGHTKIQEIKQFNPGPTAACDRVKIQPRSVSLMHLFQVKGRWSLKPQTTTFSYFHWLSNPKDTELSFQCPL